MKRIIGKAISSCGSSGKSQTQVYYFQGHNNFVSYFNATTTTITPNPIFCCSKRYYSSSTPEKTHNNKNNNKQSIEEEQHHDNLERYYDFKAESLQKYSTTTKLPLYTTDFTPSTTVSQFVESYQSLNNGEKREQNDNISLVGRIISRRESSSKLVFYTIRSNLEDVQIMLTQQQYKGNNPPEIKPEEEFEAMVATLKKGDIIGVVGFAGKTKVGELSLIPRSVKLLTPCMRPLPVLLVDKEIRYKQRYFDMLVNPEIIKAFQIRSKVISYLRSYLIERGFLEVETPILSQQVGGANAKPFVTESKALSIPLFLRISPELYLKQLVVGGVDKVFEIGKQFRNEGIDLTHNPEFTTCEFYMANANYETLIKMTEDLLSGMVRHVMGWCKVDAVKDYIDLHKRHHKTQTETTTHPETNTITLDEETPQITPHTPDTIDFTPPFKRISFVKKLRELVGDDLPEDLSSYSSVDALLNICRKHGIYVQHPHTPARLLDKLCGHFIEPLCIQPTFIYDYPIALSPLARRSKTDPNITERFELYVCGKELVNAYSELNEPKDQRNRFLSQQKDRGLGDEEAQILDENFCEALEYGLPPTVGWGLGIDRLCMLLSGTNSIRDVLWFPLSHPATK